MQDQGVSLGGQNGDRAGGAMCKKCINCNQLVVISDPNQGLLSNNQVIKMIKHM